MSTYGTYGYIKNNQRFSFAIISLSDTDTITEMYKLYLLVTNWGSTRFVQQMKSNQNGFTDEN